MVRLFPDINVRDRPVVRNQLVKVTELALIPDPSPKGRREPDSKSLSCGRGLKAFGIQEKGEGVSVVFIARFGIN